MDYSEEAFLSLPTVKKREILRNTEWDWCDIRWKGGFALFLLSLYFITFFKIKNIEHASLIITARVVGIMLALYFIGIIVKTIYFHYLKRKDIQFFNQNN